LQYSNLIIVTLYST